MATKLAHRTLLQGASDWPAAGHESSIVHTYVAIS